MGRAIIEWCAWKRLGKRCWRGLATSWSHVPRLIRRCLWPAAEIELRQGARVIYVLETELKPRGDNLASDLIELAKQNSDSVAKYTVQQIVAICGDGNLRDNCECSKHLREFLAVQSSDRLADYARFCLEQGFNALDKFITMLDNEHKRLEPGVGSMYSLSIIRGRNSAGLAFHGSDI
jgi:hypothetical protein